MSEDSRYLSCGTAFILVGLVFAGHVLLHIVSVLWANGLPVLISCNSFSSPTLCLFLLLQQSRSCRLLPHRVSGQSVH